MSEEKTGPELLPLVYDELRRAARAKMAAEAANHSLQATALVHEAYLRVMRGEQSNRWNGPAHFFAALSGAMRRILVESARRRRRLKRGGDQKRQAIDPDHLPTDEPDEALISLGEALGDLANQNPRWAQLVDLRYFLGMTLPQAARTLGVSTRTADYWWAGARSWLKERLAIDLDRIVA